MTSAAPRPIRVMLVLTFVVLVPLAAAATARIGQSQATVALLVFLTVASVRLVARAPAVGLLWVIWVTAPLARRLLALDGPPPSNDPLSLLPFACTLLLAAWDLPAVGLRKLGLPVGLAALGLLFGVPTGLASPAALGFSLVAYGSAIAATLLGATESDGERTLPRALLVLGVLSAGYGIAQYFLPVMPWDDKWLQSVQSAELASVTAPEPGHFRVFGSLNSPGTLAAFLAVAALPWLSERRRSFPANAAFALITLALALTYVRAAWLAFALASALLLLLAGRRSAIAIGAVAIIGASLLLLTSDTSSTTDALLTRFGSFGQLGTDISAQDRLGLIGRVVADAVTSPFGHGLGQAGIATRLGPAAAFAAADNGYLAILYQVGPFGFGLFIVGTALASGRLLLRAVRAKERELWLPAAIIASLLVIELFGDAMYGITGVIFWYCVGLYGGPRLIPSEATPAAMNTTATTDAGPRRR